MSVFVGEVLVSVKSLEKRDYFQGVNLPDKIVVERAFPVSALKLGGVKISSGYRKNSQREKGSAAETATIF